MMVKTAVLVAVGVIGAATTAHAGTVTEDFESCGTVTQSLGTDVSLSAANPGPCASIVPGITFSPDAGNDLYIAGPGQSANTTTALGVDYPSGGHDNISFSSPETIFSADFNQNFGGGTQSGSPAAFTIDTFFGGNLIGSYNFDVASGSSTNFGFVSSPFDFLQVSQVGTGFAVIDNVTFGTSSAVPEPATWAMMLVGFGMVGFAMRKRSNVRTTVSYA